MFTPKLISKCNEQQCNTNKKYLPTTDAHLLCKSKQSNMYSNATTTKYTYISPRHISYNQNFNFASPLQYLIHYSPRHNMFINHSTLFHYVTIIPSTTNLTTIYIYLNHITQYEREIHTYTRAHITGNVYA